MKRIWYLFGISLLIVACEGSEPIPPEEAIKEEVEGPSADNMYLHITTLYKEMIPDNKPVDKIKANQVYELGMSFLNKFPDHEKREEVMFYAENGAKHLGDLRKADGVVQMWLAENPKHDLRAEKLSTHAFLLSQLNDIAGAKKVYQKVIDEYPDSEWAGIARGELNLLNFDGDLKELPDYFEKPAE